MDLIRLYRIGIKYYCLFIITSQQKTTATLIHHIGHLIKIWMPYYLKYKNRLYIKKTDQYDMSAYRFYLS
ncbi:hypothetical protein GCM10017554_31470 [Acinetobacter modestus]|nr:hypothetical protein GCM10017554_31470 [Acinetobacter modestus]